MLIKQVRYVQVETEGEARSYEGTVLKVDEHGRVGDDHASVHRLTRRLPQLVVAAPPSIRNLTQAGQGDPRRVCRRGVLILHFHASTGSIIRVDPQQSAKMSTPEKKSERRGVRKAALLAAWTTFN